MNESAQLAPELRALVKVSVAWLGRVIRGCAGEAQYRTIEKLRREVASLRGAPREMQMRTLRGLLVELRALSPKHRREIARAFTLMLELMNACETAYRSHRLRRRSQPPSFAIASEGIIFVLTSHPTEARNPANIALFHRIQSTLLAWLEEGGVPPEMRGAEVPDRPRGPREEELLHLLELAWRTPTARGRRPSVEDEAVHLYSILLRPESLETLLEAYRRIAPTFVRTWVGGDKDGNPHVDARRMTASLQCARDGLLREALACIRSARSDLESLPGRARPHRAIRGLRQLEGLARELRLITTGDGARVRRFRTSAGEAVRIYGEDLGAESPVLIRLLTLTWMFPALVVPLELRESSDQVALAARGPARPVTRMLETLARISRGGEPMWYARGLILSMVSKPEDVRAGLELLRRIFGTSPIPVIPLFEQAAPLRGSGEIMREILSDAEYREAAAGHWSGQVEVMLGYSDSAKEMGVLPSRLAIARAVGAMDKVITRAGLRPVFFHGSGGSVDRGGGSIDEQTSWWPVSALTMYKATVQGEMVERTFASAEIMRTQLERIARRVGEAVSTAGTTPSPSGALRRFSGRTHRAYREMLGNPLFLELVAHSTVYPYLDLLKMGSRPASRAADLSIASLRAIPWVMCWTQARLLFPTWWGVGHAWSHATDEDRQALAREFHGNDLFRSFVKALGFTLAKVELPVFEIQAESWMGNPRRAGMEERRSILATIDEEFRLACAFVRAVSGNESLVWFRPWLETSIRLRSPMIHPLNLLQILAMEERDPDLMRETVTGISSGMMTTG